MAQEDIIKTGKNVQKVFIAPKFLCLFCTFRNSVTLLITLSIFSLAALKLCAFFKLLLKFFSCFIDSLTAGCGSRKNLNEESVGK